MVHRTAEEEARRTVLAEDLEAQENDGRTAVVEEGDLHNGLVEVQEVRRSAVEEAVAGSHHRVAEAEARLEEDSNPEVADIRLAGEDTAQEEVVGNRHMVVEVGDDHNLEAAAVLEAFKSELLSQSVYISTYGRREHHNLGKT